MMYGALLLVVLVALSAFFSGAETAFTSLSSMQIERLSSEKGSRGRMISRIMRRSELLLGTVLIGNSLANISASAIATELTIRYFGSRSIGYTTGALTVIILIFAEVTPKRFAIGFNEAVCLHTVRVITFLSWLFRPVIWVVSAMSSLLSRLIGERKRRGLTLEGLLHMVNLAENLGIVASRETRMVKSIFRFNDVAVQAIMTHRTKVFSIEMRSRISDAVGEIGSHGFSRVPVYDEHPEKIEGIVHLRDVVASLAAGRASSRLEEIMVKPLFIPTTRKIDELYADFKREKTHMAIVLDEYGGLAGIVTAQDITEEVLGELREEHAEAAPEKIRPDGDGAFLVMGDTPIYQVNDFIGLSLPQRKRVQTIAGYLAELLDRFPVERETVSVPGALFVIEKIASNRVVSVRCIPREVEAVPGER